MSHEATSNNHNQTPLHESGEAMAKGAEILAANVGAVMEHSGPDAVKDYLGDVLSGPDSQAPAEERLALFELSSKHIVDASEDTLIDQGDQMVKSLRGADDRWGRRIGENSQRAKSSFDRNVDEFEGEMKRFVRSDESDERYRSKLTGVSESSTGSLLKSSAAIDGNITDLSTWSTGQKQATSSFSEQHQKADKTKRNLKNARKTIDPEYDGPPVDLSKLIDGQTLESVAESLKEIVEKSDTGEQSTEAVLGLIEEEPDKTKAELIDKYDDFAHGYYDFVNTEVAKISRENDEVKPPLKAAMNSGDEYYRVRGSADAEDILRKQLRFISQSHDSADEVFKRIKQTFDASAEKIEGIEQATSTEQLARV